MKKSNSYLMHTCCVLLTLILSCSLIISCGRKEPEPPAEPEKQETSAAGETSVSADGEKNDDSRKDDESSDTDESDTKKTGGIEDAIGEWEMVYSKSHSVYGTEDEPYDNITMSSDPYSVSSEMIIRKKDGKLTADYRYNGYETDIRYVGIDLEQKTGAAYDGCENKDWYFEFSDPFTDGRRKEKYTLLADGSLIGVSEYNDGTKGADDYYYSLDTEVYLRKDSPEMKNKEDLRYFETVTVSSLEELINNMDSNKKVILKNGKYNFAKLDKRKIDEEHISHLLGKDEIDDGYRTYTINDLNNFCIEAEEPGKVTIVTEEAYDPVMFFRYAHNLTLRGLVIGHDVEPGYCSGSVVGFDGSSGITVDNCRLYGCGTYGLEIKSTEYVNVKDTEIYECTYGLLDIYESSQLHFEKCTFRDSREMSMINVNSGYDLVFDDCSFKDNIIDPQYNSVCYFAELSEYSEVTFNNCTFDKNQYGLFSNRKVTMQNCTMNDNVSAQN